MTSSDDDDFQKFLDMLNHRICPQCGQKMDVLHDYRIVFICGHCGECWVENEEDDSEEF